MFTLHYWPLYRKGIQKTQDKPMETTERERERERNVGHKNVRIREVFYDEEIANITSTEK